MATVKVIRPTMPPPIEAVVLTLSEHEAKMVATLSGLGRMDLSDSGKRELERNGFYSPSDTRVWDALRAAGIEVK